MITNNASKIVKAFRSKLLGGNLDAVIACAIAYSAPLPVDTFGNATCECNSFYNTNIHLKVLDILDTINELHVISIGTILETTKETYRARLAAISNPITQPMSVTANFKQNDLDAVECLIELIRTEFTGG